MEVKSIYKAMAEVLKDRQQEILKLWVEQIMASGKRLVETVGEEDCKRFARDLLDGLTKAMPSGDDIETETYSEVRAINEKLSSVTASKDITPSETATFVFSLKDAMLASLQNAFQQKERLNEVSGAVNRLIDKMGLFTFETFMKSRERIIKEQQKALLEVSVPVVKVWDKILMVPLVGMLDSARTQLVMETLLTAIEETQSKVAILDISGIPVVDTLVAKHLMRTVSAAKLMGAECIITGIKSRISQTIVQLGVDLTGIVTKTTLADGLKVALDLTGQKVTAK